MVSKLLLYEKSVQDDGAVSEMKIWQVPKSLRNPQGVKYSLYLVKESKILVGYDNHHPKGHHRHYGTKQEPYAFTTVEALIDDFNEDRKRLHHEG